MKPDGGVLFAVKDGKRTPILLTEDKVQGTNDSLKKEGKKRQATGNAIERGGKNIRGAEMIFAGLRVFPYILFASGCDFHSSETIAKRIEMMNFGFPNHSIELGKDTTEDFVDARMGAILAATTIEKRAGCSVASVFVKTHKWDELEHGASLWKKKEIVAICKRVLDLVFETIS
jgi:hypothetical protein